MAHCCSPGCHRNDVTNDEQTLYFERVGEFEKEVYDTTWIVVCEKHIDRNNPTIELTDGVKDVDR